MTSRLPAGTAQAQLRLLLGSLDRQEPEINSLVYRTDIAELNEDVSRQQPGSESSECRFVVIKDNIAVRHAPWACGSASRPHASPDYDAPVVTSLRESGGIIIGTANMDEFAMGASTETSAWGPSRNPWNLHRSPGGSSGGSAAAVAAYDVLALGTDTGGSIREPASQCGIVGLKPTHGDINLDGVLPFAPSFDTIGPMASTVAATAWLHDVIAGFDRRMQRAALAGNNCAGWDVDIGVISQMSGDSNSPEIRSAFDDFLRRLRDLGARIHEVSLPSTLVALNTYFVLSSVEAVPVLEQHEATGQLGNEAQYRLDQGRALADTPIWDDAKLDRERISSEITELFSHCDVLLSPTMPLVAPLLTRADLTDPLLIPRTDWWTVEANLAGIPAISVPAGLGSNSGLPIGMQMMAPRGHDAELYFGAAALMRARA